MDFLAEECDAWFGPRRPPPAVLKAVLDRLAMAPRKLPKHHAWLQRVLGMPEYRTTI
jgi:hypothetical protein